MAFEDCLLQESWPAEACDHVHHVHLTPFAEASLASTSRSLESIGMSLKKLNQASKPFYRDPLQWFYQAGQCNLLESPFKQIWPMLFANAMAVMAI